jgi:hypothetical protein
MYKVKAQKNDDHHNTAEVFKPGFVLDYGTLFEVTEATIEAADDYAATWCADVFHDNTGLSTVYFDDGQYTCFWFSDLGV